MKKTFRFILMILIIIIGFSTLSYAEVSLSTTTVNMNINQTKNVTLNGNGVTGTVSVESSNSNIATVSISNNWIENNSINISINGKSAGSATITVSGKVANSTTGKENQYSKIIYVNVLNNQTSSNNNSNTNNNSNSGGQTINEKSSIATLSNLGIRPNDFSGFKPNTYSYNVEVPSDLETIEVYANKGQNGQKISGTGKKTLKEGKNSFNIIVTAEDGKTQKTYTINITRKQNQEVPDTDTSDENTEENSEETPIEKMFGLTELKIQGVKLEPEFQTDVYEYRIELKEDLDKLDLTTVATELGSDIEITGNENLHEGENVITIIVKGKSEAETVAYQIIVNKEIENNDDKIDEEQYNKEKIKKVILVSILGGIIFVIIIVVIIIKVKKSKNMSNNYIPYENIVDNYEDKKQIEKNEDESYEQYSIKKKHKKGKRFK